MVPPMRKSPQSNLTEIAIRYLSYRPRFKAEVVNRLAKKALELKIKDPLTLINQIINSLEESGFIDDAKLLESYIISRLTQKAKGPNWIRRRLARFGLAKPVIDQALKDFAPVSLQKEMIRRFLAKKLPIGQLDFKAKARFFRALLNRGFTYELVRSSFDSGTAWE